MIWLSLLIVEQIIDEINYLEKTILNVIIIDHHQINKIYLKK